MRRAAPLLFLGVALFAAPLARSQDEGLKGAAIAGWRIYAKKPGLIRVPIADLPGHALCPAPGSDPGLQLTTRGEPVAFWVNEARNTLVFFAEPDIESHDARGRCYHLRPKAAGDVVRLLEGKPEPAGAFAADAATDKGEQRIEPREERSYHALESLDAASLATLEKPGGYWLYDRPLTFECPAAGEAELVLAGVWVLRVHRTEIPGGRYFEELGLHSKSRAGKLRVKLGAFEKTLDLTQPCEGLHVTVPVGAGKNVLELAAEPEGTVLVARAWLQLEAPVRPGVPFGAKGPTTFERFDGAIAADLTTGRLLEVKGSKNACSVNAEKGHEVLVFDPKTASGGGRLEVCRKHAPVVDADWIAVAPRALLEAVRPLEEHRRAQGLSTELVAYEDACDDFDDGRFGRVALQQVARHAKFLLLVGDAWRDARPDDGPWIPTRLVDTYDNGATATDRVIEGKERGPAVGRFPCRTSDEVKALVAKTIAYEKCPSGAWQKQLSFVCGEGRFGPMVDGLIENLFNQAVSKRVPASFDIDVTYANPQSIYFYPPDDFSKRVVDRLSAGPLVFDYIGHGAPETFDTVHWERKRFPILTAEDAAKVSCEDGHYPIALITACWTGAFDQPERTVGEALLLNPTGAVAVLAASRISHPFANALLSLELTEKLFQESDAPLGDRIRAALDGLSLESGNAEGKLVVSFGSSMLEEDGLGERLIEDERHLYNLLGDPALRVRLPRPISVDAPAGAPAGTSVSVTAKSEIAACTLERARAVRTDLQGLDPATKPSAMKDEAVLKQVLATYARANDFVCARGVLDGVRAVLALPRDLAPGTYVIKVLTKDGGAGSARLVVQKPTPPKKKYY